MINQGFNILSSIVVLAIIAVALSRKSNAEGVIGKFWNGFSTALKRAGQAGR